MLNFHSSAIAQTAALAYDQITFNSASTKRPLARAGLLRLLTGLTHECVSELDSVTIEARVVLVSGAHGLAMIE